MCLTADFYKSDVRKIADLMRVGKDFASFEVDFIDACRGWMIKKKVHEEEYDIDVGSNIIMVMKEDLLRILHEIVDDDSFVLEIEESNDKQGGQDVDLGQSMDDTVNVEKDGGVVNNVTIEIEDDDKNGNGTKN